MKKYLVAVTNQLIAYSFGAFLLNDITNHQTGWAIFDGVVMVFGLSVIIRDVKKNG